jgi:membrane-bound lytic murein transglycosylase B
MRSPLVALALLLALPFTSPAAEESLAPSEAGLALEEAAPPALPSADPFMAAVRAALAEQDVAIAALQRAMDAAPDEASALARQREIQTRKQETELTILRLQAERALAEGRAELAAEIARAIDAIKNPPQPQVEATRDEPAAPAGGR